LVLAASLAKGVHPHARSTNLQTLTHGNGGSTDYSYEPHGPIDTDYTFDADGNLATRDGPGPSQTFTFDRVNRLRRVEEGASTLAEYLYDPFGRRTQKTASGVTTWFLWDGDQLLGEYDGSGARTRRYAYAGGFAPLQVADPDGGSGETIYDVHTDHLDTPRLLTDSGGNDVWRGAYEAFGTAALDPGNGVTFNVRFPGQYFDAETGISYNRFRYYDPAIARYISADPVGQFTLLAAAGVAHSRTRRGGEAFPGASEVDPTSGQPPLSTLILAGVEGNMFPYALSNPMSLSDPTGEGFLPFFAAAVAVTFGVGGPLLILDCIERLCPPEQCDLDGSGAGEAQVLRSRNKCIADCVRSVGGLTTAVGGLAGGARDIGSAIGRAIGP
jgi:RHS repeat-associated protein